MERNNPDRSLSRRQEKNLLKAAEVNARSEFESPERTACPEARILKLLAHRHSSAAESPDLIDHIGTCSPCFIEYSRYRAVHKLRVRVSYTLASVAALIGITILLARSPFFPVQQPSGKDADRTPEQFTEYTLDLRMRGVSRSDTANPQPDSSPRLPRTRLSLSIFLPTGSEEGTYEVALLGSSGQILGSAAGEAKLRNFIQVLPVKLNLSDLASGGYELRIRRAEMPWSTYSIVLE